MNYSTALGLLLAAWGLLTPADLPAPYRVDPDASQVVLHVDKGGLFSFMGHAHEIHAPVAEGTIVVVPEDLPRSSVHLTLDATGLKVIGTREPAGDLPQIQHTMESERVLDVARFPQIRFDSTGVEVLEDRADSLRVRVTGNLTLHGVTEPTTSEVSVVLDEGRVTATGTFVVKQTHFGIEPVTAGAGTVRVKDEVQIAFRLVAVQ